MQDETLKVGLLMESAQAHQRLVEENLATLSAHTRDLDAIVRDEIRRTLLEELQSLHAETERTIAALRSAARVAGARKGFVALAFSAVCSFTPAAVLWNRLPSQAEIGLLSTERDALTLNLARLQAAGARVEWRRCGETQRLCARVDRSAPAYGERSDFLVLKGY
jgi:hypothetical protein